MGLTHLPKGWGWDIGGSPPGQDWTTHTPLPFPRMQLAHVEKGGEVRLPERCPHTCEAPISSCLANLRQRPHPLSPTPSGSHSSPYSLLL